MYTNTLNLWLIVGSCLYYIHLVKKKKVQHIILFQAAENIWGYSVCKLTYKSLQLKSNHKRIFPESSRFGSGFKSSSCCLTGF